MQLICSLLKHLSFKIIRRLASFLPGKTRRQSYIKISNCKGFGEKFFPKSVKSPIPYSPTNVQWSCQPFWGWGKKRIWNLSKCHPSTKWLARVHHVVGFKTKVLHFKIENTPIKDTNGKKKFNTFSFCGKKIGKENSLNNLTTSILSFSSPPARKVTHERKRLPSSGHLPRGWRFSLI